MLPPASTPKRNWSHPPKTALLNCVSKWKRQHAGKHLHILYAPKYVETLQDIEKIITGSVQKFTEEQKDYISYLNQHLTFSSSLIQLCEGSETVATKLKECETYVDKLEVRQGIKQKSWLFMKLKAFVNALLTLGWTVTKYKKDRLSQEGFFTEFIRKFGELCCLEVQTCAPAHHVTWEKLKGIKVTSQPDLRFFKRGLDDKFSVAMVSVTEVKHPDLTLGGSDSYLPPKKKSKGSPRLTSTDASTDEEMHSPEMNFERNPGSVVTIDEDHPSGENPIELLIHDEVLGQHAGELLLELHDKYRTDDESKYNLEKKIYMPGMIVVGTAVNFTALEMTWNHYQKLKKNTVLQKNDEATIYYSRARDILWMEDRKHLIADFMRLNNIEFDSA